MCGIAGIISFDGASIDRKALQRMITAIGHRGGDDEGFTLINRTDRAIRRYSGDHSCPEIKTTLPHLYTADSFSATAGLAHCRFSIIDVSSSAHQPFLSPDSTHALAFNGELYNYRELRDELAAHNVKCRTTSDTEVFLEAWRTWGTDSFSRMNGFWAAAMYDAQRNVITLCRDRIGKKPLLYAIQNGFFYFASEIKALLAIPSISNAVAVNEDAAYTWLMFNRKNLGSETFFKGIQLFPKGSFLELGDSFTKNFIPYWQLPQTRLKESDIGPQEAARKLRRLLVDAVALRLRADVPVGLELSGGLDSSVLCAAMKEIGAELPCFTVHFDEADETPYARAVADKLGAHLEVLSPPPNNLWRNIGAFTCLQEEPYHSPNLQSNQETFIRMRERGIKVSINGAAGDECFAGYEGYFWSMQWEHLLHGNISQFINNARKYSEHPNPLKAGLYTPLYVGARALFDHFPFSRGGFSYTGQVPRHRTYTTSAPLSRRILDDMHSTLMPYWLASGDRTYMGVPLEVRMPFLDHHIIDFAFTLPLSYCIRDGWHKWIVRKAFEDTLPAEVVWRKKKMGFPFPLPTFLRDNRNIIDLIMREAGNPYIKPTSAGDPGNMAWRPISFMLWHAYFIQKNMGLFKKIEAIADGSGPIAGGGYTPAYLGTCQL